MLSTRSTRINDFAVSHESLGELYSRHKTIERFADFTAETRMTLVFVRTRNLVCFVLVGRATYRWITEIFTA